MPLPPQARQAIQEIGAQLEQIRLRTQAARLQNAVQQTEVELNLAVANAKKAASSLSAAFETDVPTALTDLDTTVTGAQLNAKHLAGSLSLLGQTISATYSQSEVQAISDAVDAIIQLLLDTQIAGTAGPFYYFRPGGVDQYYRPGGVDRYIRP